MVIGTFFHAVTMRKILIAVGSGVVAVVIALGARNQFASRAQPGAADGPVEEAPATPAPGGVALADSPVVFGDPEGRGEQDGHDIDTTSRSGPAPAGVGDGPTAGGAVPRPDADPGVLPASEVSERVGGAEPEATASDTPEPAASEDATEILRRASAAYERVTSLSAAFTQRMDNRVLGTQVVSRGMMYQRHPDRFLMKFEEPAGDIIVSDGEYFWVYYPSVDEKQVIRMPVRQGNAGAVDLRSQFVGDPVRRFEAKLEGKDAAAGREAHVLTLVPREPVGYRQLRVWVDAADHLVRRFEIVEANSNTRAFELRDLRINPRLDDDLFRFTPPPGARIVDRS